MPISSASKWAMSMAMPIPVANFVNNLCVFCTYQIILMSMNTLQYLLLGALALIFGLSACTLSPTEQMLASGSVAPIHQDTLPFELRKGFIVVRAQLNGMDMPIDFIWDSGAASRLPGATLAYLGLSGEASQTGDLLMLDSLKLGNTVFYDLAFERADYEGYSPPKCIAEGGVIGANLIRNANWLIDFEQQILVLSAKDAPLGPAGPTHRLPFSADKVTGEPKLKANVEGFSKARLLTACVGRGTGLNWPVSQRPANAVRAYDRQIKTVLRAGVDSSFLLPKAQAQLGSLKWEGTVNCRMEAEGRVGNEIWQSYTLGLNYGREELLLWPRQGQAETPPALPALGWMPHFDPMGELTVGYVIEGSPAWEAGLRVGDVVDQIDRRAAPGWYNDFCTYLFGVEAQFAKSQQMVVKLRKQQAPAQLQLSPQ